MPSHRYRQVDPDLAGLMSCESAVAPSETNEEGSPYTEYREVPSGLAGLLHASESVTSGADIHLGNGSSVIDVSSLTGSSESPSLLGAGGGGDRGQVESSNSATSRSVDEETVESNIAGTLNDYQWWERASVSIHAQHGDAPMVLRPRPNRAEEQSRWDSDGSSTRYLESRRVRFSFSDTSSRDFNLQDRRLQRRRRRATERQRCAARAVYSKLRAVGAFMRNGRSKTKRMLAMWFRRNGNMNLDVMRLIGEYCWRDGWRGVAGSDGDHTGTLEDQVGWERASVSISAHDDAPLVLRLRPNRAEEQLHRDSDAAGAFMWSARNKTKRMLALYFLLEQSTLDVGVVRLIGEFCWADVWRGVAGGGGDNDRTRMPGVEASAAAAAAVTRLAFRLAGAVAVAAEAEAEAEAARELAALELANGSAGR